jgi:hypothetical protein
VQRRQTSLARKLQKGWGFLLVDARNAFKEGNRMLMLWTTRHEWASGARFIFNCCRHFAMLVIRTQAADCSLFF